MAFSAIPIPVLKADASSIEKGESLRLQGNEAFGAGRWEEAIFLYTESIQHAPKDPRGWCNRAQAHLKAGNPLYAYGDAYHVLDLLEPTNRKALVRLALAAHAMGLWDEAKAAYIKLLPPRLDMEGVMNPEVPIQSLKLDADDSSFVRGLRECEIGNAASALEAAATAGYGNYTSDIDEARRLEDARKSKVDGTCLIKCASLRTRDEEQVLARAPAVLLSGRPATLQKVPGAGLGLYATREIKAGEVILSEIPIIAASPDPARCYYCLKPNVTYRCRNGGKGCKKRYCSKECEKKASDAFHRPLCGKDTSVLEATVASSLSTTGRIPLVVLKLLGMRMLHLGRGRNVDDPGLVPDGFTWLATSWPRIKHRALPFLSYWRLFRDLMKGEEILFSTVLSMQAFVAACMMARTNSISAFNHDIKEFTVRDTATVIMLGGSFINHSCEPNAMFDCAMESCGSFYMMNALRDIHCGEEITIGYTQQDTSWLRILSSST